MQQTCSCPYCGAQVVFGVRFCTNCGTPLSWPGQQEVQPPRVWGQQEERVGVAAGYNPRDRIYLSLAEVPNDPWGDINMVFCNGAGVLSMSHVDQSVIDSVHKALSEYRAEGKCCAVVCLDIGNNQSVTSVVEIGHDEALALGAILTTVLDNRVVGGMVPEAYKEHVGRIIEVAREEMRRLGW